LVDAKGRGREWLNAAALPCDGSRGNYSLYGIVSIAVSHLCAFIISRHRSRRELPWRHIRPSLIAKHRCCTRGNTERERSISPPLSASPCSQPQLPSHLGFRPLGNPQSTLVSVTLGTISIVRTPTNRRIKSGDILHYHEVCLTSCVIHRVCIWRETWCRTWLSRRTELHTRSANRG